MRTFFILASLAIAACMLPQPQPQSPTQPQTYDPQTSSAEDPVEDPTPAPAAAAPARRSCGQIACRQTTDCSGCGPCNEWTHVCNLF